MAEDVAFRIQLGLILPKIKDSLGGDLKMIVDEVVNIVQAGTVDGGTVDLAAIKEIVMKDLEIFLDKEVFPTIDQRLNPPAAEQPAAEAGEAGASEETPADE